MSYSGCLCAGLLLLSAILSPQDTAETVRNGTIQGIVTESTTGEALAGVEVWIESPEPPVPDLTQLFAFPVERFLHVTLTDPEGRFLLENVPPGDYRLYADGVGLLQQEFGQRSPGSVGTLIGVREGGRLNVSISMHPPGTILGHVVDGDGEAVPGIPVYAKGYQFRGGKHVLLELSQIRLGRARRAGAVSPGTGYAVTDESGAYRLTGLPPGDYVVVVRYRAGEEARDGFDAIVERDSVAPVYYPNTLRVDDAVLVPVAGSAVSGIDVRWRAIRPVSVRGQVVGLGDGPTSFSVTTPDGVLVEPVSATTGRRPDGTFEVLLPPFQSYLLNALSLTTREYGATRIDVGDEDLENISVDLKPPVILEGQIIVAPGTPSINFSEQTVMVYFDQGLDSDYVTSKGFSRVLPDGRLPGSERQARDGYRLSLESLPEGYYIESAIVGSTDALVGGFDLSAAPPRVFLTIRLASGTGEVTGTVLDATGRPRAGATVTLVPGGIYTDRYDRYLSAFTDGEGEFRLADVPPGPYQAFAWDQIPIGAEMNQEFLGRFRGRGRTFRIDPGGVTVDLELRTIDSPF